MVDVAAVITIMRDLHTVPLIETNLWQYLTREVNHTLKGIARFHYKIVFPSNLVIFPKFGPRAIWQQWSATSSYGTWISSWHQRAGKLAPKRA